MSIEHFEQDAVEEPSSFFEAFEGLQKANAALYRDIENWPHTTKFRNEDMLQTFISVQNCQTALANLSDFVCAEQATQEAQATIMATVLDDCTEKRRNAFGLSLPKDKGLREARIAALTEEFTEALDPKNYPEVLHVTRLADATFLDGLVRDVETLRVKAVQEAEEARLKRRHQTQLLFGGSIFAALLVSTYVSWEQSRNKH